MIESIDINRRHPHAKRLHFLKAKFERLNILFGGNGSGKSTLLNLLEKQDSTTSSSDVVIMSYRNSIDNDRRNDPSPFSDGSIYATQLARRFHASGISEGQGIIYSFSNFIGKVKDSIEKNDVPHVVILDEIDSGLSCDHVQVVVSVLIELLNECEKVQAFVATNMFHWAFTYKHVFSMYTGKFIEIGSYDEYYRIQMDNQLKVGEKSDFNFL